MGSLIQDLWERRKKASQALEPSDRINGPWPDSDRAWQLLSDCLGTPPSRDFFTHLTGHTPRQVAEMRKTFHDLWDAGFDPRSFKRWREARDQSWRVRTGVVLPLPTAIRPDLAGTAEQGTETGS